MKTLRWIVLLPLLVGFNALAQDDICKEQGGTADCIGPLTGPYTFQLSDGFNYVEGTDEAATIAAYEAVYTAALTPFGLCSFSLVDNRPPIPPASYGTGTIQYGDYGTALFAGTGQYLNVSWRLSVDWHAEQIPLRVSAVYGDQCQFSGTHGAYVNRYRVVTCPVPTYIPNGSGVPDAYCYRSTPSLDPPKNHGQQCPMDGNPVNPGVGNKFQMEVDYEGTGGSGLRFVRYYNNRLWTGAIMPDPVMGYRSSLGPNWRSTYDRAIRFTDSVAFPTVYAYRHDGRTLHFRLKNGVFAGDADIADRLEQLNNGSGVITGWRYTIAETEDVETYDSSGKLLSIRSRSGLTLTLTYDGGGRLSQVTDAFGRTLTFTYGVAGALETFTDPNGRTFSYGYSAAGNVSSVTYPDSTTRSYIYNEAENTGGATLPFAMTGVVDEMSSRYATFKYDGGEAAVSTEHAGGTQKYSFQYSGTDTVVIDPLGQSRVYGYAWLHGMAKIISMSQPCASGCGGGSAAATTYDDSGNVASRTDFNGNGTCYAYDLPRHLETARLEGLAPGLNCPSNLASYFPAAGTRERKITTQWHATYRLPTQVDEPGRRTTYTHDVNGNVLTRTELDMATSTSRTWAYTYNGYGRMLTSNGPRTDVSDVTTYTYYSCTTGYHCGQVHTVTNAAGHVTTYNTYNAHGQPLTMTDPNGVVTTLTYDLRQRLTSRTVGTEVTTFEYWPTGLLKKATLPDGSYLSYTYDAAHRLHARQHG
jgi:YD repeat-containing protein